MSKSRVVRHLEKVGLGYRTISTAAKELGMVFQRVRLHLFGKKTTPRHLNLILLRRGDGSKIERHFHSDVYQSSFLLDYLLFLYCW